jgi:hypothetical protein
MLKVTKQQAKQRPKNQLKADLGTISFQAVIKYPEYCWNIQSV